MSVRPALPTGLAPCFGAEMARLRITDPLEVRRRMLWVLAILPEEDSMAMRQAMAGYAFRALQAVGLSP